MDPVRDVYKCSSSEHTVHMRAKLLQSCPTSVCDPMDCSLPGSSVSGVFQARILEWVAVPFSRESSDPGMQPVPLLSPALAGRFFTTSATWEVLYYTQYVLTETDPLIGTYGIVLATFLAPESITVKAGVSVAPEAHPKNCLSVWYYPDIWG